VKGESKDIAFIKFKHDSNINNKNPKLPQKAPVERG
jgi:hypothetical protein